MPKIVTFIALVLWATANAASDPLCGVMAARAAGPPIFAPEEGILVQSEPLFPAEAVTFRLGQGNVGTVYRVSLPREVFVAKIYRDYRRGWDKETLSWREKIAAGHFQQADLAILSVCRREEPSGLLVPSVSAVTINGSPALRFRENLYGKSVFHLLQDPNIPADFKVRLEKSYREKLEEFAEFLRRELKGKGEIRQSPEDVTPAHRYPFLEMQVEYTYEGTRTSTHVHIAADGILVDAYTFDFWLVDPK